MHTETIAGLHKCQPKNAPEAGTIKNMVVLNMPAKNGKKAWIKITNRKPEEGGSPYRILNVEALDWPPDQYGNVAMNLEVEATTAQPTAFSQARATMSETRRGEQQGEPVSMQDAVFHPERIRDHMPDAQQGEPTHQVIGTDSGVRLEPTQSPPQRPSMLDERQRAIIRQHSQSMALEVLKLKVTVNELTIEDLTPAKLRALANYFDADVMGATE